MADLRAAVLLPLRGPLAMQAREAARGLRLWAGMDGVDLELVETASPLSVTELYYRWLRDDKIQLVLGPYGSGLVRRVLPAVGRAGKVLWNHGGSADDLAKPGVVQLAAPASTYLVGAVRLCGWLDISRVAVVAGKGPFSAFVARGAIREARRMGMEATLVTAADDVPVVEPAAALLSTTGFRGDVELVKQVRSSGAQPALLGCVAAGVPQFGERLGAYAEGVVGPSQWAPTSSTPGVGMSGRRFAQLYKDAYGQPPGYVAAQATAAGLLAAYAHRRGMSRSDLVKWRTSTLLGEFGLDAGWRQVAHSVTTIQWRNRRMKPVP